MSIKSLAAYWQFLWANLYQRIFPHPFRIIPATAPGQQTADDNAIETLLTNLPQAAPAALIPVELARELCNEHFYLISHLKKLENTDNMRLLRRLRSVADNLQQIMARYGIEYRDLTGQDYHAGRVDFTNFAPAEINPALNTAQIILCEHPAVFLDGKLIQTARGIVARPA